MVVRHYGVKNAAGTSVTEEDVRGPIVPGGFGAAAYVGKFERGIPGEPIVMVGPKQMKRKVGGRIADSIAPDAVDDFWDHSAGAGLVLALRILDGTEVASGGKAYSRHTGVGFGIGSYSKGDAERPFEEVLEFTAKNGGRWAGRYRLMLKRNVTVSGNLTATTVDLAETMLLDEYAGGYVVIGGTHSLASKLHKIISNTIAGVVTVQVGATMLADVQETSQATVDIFLWLPSVLVGKSKRKGVQYMLKEGTLGGGLEFGLDVYVDGERVHGWASLSMNPDSPRYAPAVVNNDSANEELEIVDLLQMGVAIDEYNRPGNFTRMVTDITSTKLWFQPVTIERHDVSSDVNIVSYEVDAAADASFYGLLPGLMVFTWVDADSKYVVAFETTVMPGIDVLDLPDWDPVAPADYNIEYDPGTVLLPKVTIDHITDPADGSQFAIHVMPVTTNMVGGMVYPDTDAQKFNGFKVREVSHDSVTVESGDPSAVASVGDVGSVVGTIDDDPLYTITVDTNDKMLIAIDGRDWVTVQIEDDISRGHAASAAEVVSDINDAFDLVFGVGVLNPAYVATTDPGGIDYVALRSNGGFDGYGPAATVTLKYIVNSVYVTLGFTVPGIGGSVTHRGTSGTRARIEYLQDLSDGYDGGEPPLQKYMDAFATSSSPLNKVAESGYGNIMLNCPGVTSRLSASEAVMLHKQGILYAEANPYVYFGETPADKTDEADVQYYWETEVGRSDMLATFIPSFVNVTDPDSPKKLKEVSSLPQVMGLWAKFAVKNEGYHKPAAGRDARLTKIVSLPEGYGVMNEEFLTPGGYNIIKKRGGHFVVWGARTVFENSLWMQLSVRMQMNHFVWVFLDNWDWVIFQLNDRLTWVQIEASFVQYLKEQWAKRILAGRKESDAFSVKIDADNNPQGEIDVGTAHLDAQFNFTKFIERFKISIGAGGVSEAV